MLFLSVIYGMQRLAANAITVLGNDWLPTYRATAPYSRLAISNNLSTNQQLKILLE